MVPRGLARGLLSLKQGARRFPRAGFNVGGRTMGGAGKTVCRTWICALGLFLGSGLERAMGDPEFLRGDVNADGRVSMSDGMMMAIYIFIEPESTFCRDAADLNDDGYLDLFDSVTLFSQVSGLSAPSLPGPFPEPGNDLTPDDALDCEVYSVEPAQPADDLVRIGSIDAAPGQEVEVPVFITNAVGVEAIQLVISYDPRLFTPTPQGSRAFNFQQTAWEAALESRPGEEPRRNYGWFKWQNPYPEQNLFSITIATDYANEGFDLPPGMDQLAFKFRGKVSAEATPGTVVSFQPTNGPDGQGVLPPFYLRN
jgi:hypothetical protein